MINNSIREETKMKYCDDCKTKAKCRAEGCQKKGYAAGGLKMPGDAQKGLKKLPTAVRNKMGYMYGGGMAKKMNKGGYCGASNPAERPMKKSK